jgi:hypothetical protein
VDRAQRRPSALHRELQSCEVSRAPHSSQRSPTESSVRSSRPMRRIVPTRACAAHARSRPLPCLVTTALTAASKRLLRGHAPAADPRRAPRARRRPERLRAKTSRKRRSA